MREKEGRPDGKGAGGVGLALGQESISQILKEWLDTLGHNVGTLTGSDEPGQASHDADVGLGADRLQ